LSFLAIIVEPRTLESRSQALKTRIIAQNPQTLDPRNCLDWSTPRGWWRHPNV